MALVWKIILIALSFISFLSFAWAIHSHFSNSKQSNENVGMKVIKVLAPFFFLIQILAMGISGDVSLLNNLVALLLYLASISIFWWAVSATARHRLSLAFTTDEPEFILITGPYRHVRHPFYLAYSLFWIAGVFAGDRLLLAVIPSIMVLIYYRAASFEEKKFIDSSQLGKDYETYRTKTGILLPKLLAKRKEFV